MRNAKAILDIYLIIVLKIRKLRATIALILCRWISKKSQMKRRISKLPNLGHVSEQMLAEVGITSVAELKKQDPVEVYILLKVFGYNVNLNMLWALYGAINDCDWKLIDERTKKQLQSQLEKRTDSI